MTRPLRVLAALAAVSALALTGCGTIAEPQPSASPESAYGGFPVDPPADDEVVLTIEGATTVDFTYAQLQQLADVEIDIVEPFINERQSFTGVALAELLDRAEVPADARIETIALNDYIYADTVEQWSSNGAILAVFRDGELIPMDQGGPIRIVFPADSSAFEVLDAWNWSLRTIAVAD